MTETHTLTESQPKVLRLDEDQAVALADLGRRLASDRAWWGQDQQDEATRRPSVLRCEPYGPQTWKVSVDDAIGVLAVRDLQLNVLPKIPLDHVLWLFAASGQFPRLDPEEASLASATELWDLVAHWCVTAMEEVIRKDLIKDYVERREQIGVIRGRINVLDTAQAYYRGSLQVTCEFDEFEVDTPLNRILLAAARIIAQSSLLARELRRRAIRLIARMEGIGEVQPADFRVQIDRRTAHYRRAAALARHVISGTGRTLQTGVRESHGFLIPTPGMIEGGLRNILTSELEDLVVVAKRGRQLEGSTMTFNPDLVFGSVAIGDVKYKVYESEWKRVDLYQVLAFCTAYRTNHGMVAAFGTDVPQNVTSGDFDVTAFLWHPTEDPTRAQTRFVRSIRDWLIRLGA